MQFFKVIPELCEKNRILSKEFGTVFFIQKIPVFFQTGKYTIENNIIPSRMLRPGRETSFQSPIWLTAWKVRPLPYTPVVTRMVKKASGSTSLMIRLMAASWNLEITT